MRKRYTGKRVVAVSTLVLILGLVITYPFPGLGGLFIVGGFVGFIVGRLMEH